MDKNVKWQGTFKVGQIWSYKAKPEDAPAIFKCVRVEGFVPEIPEFCCHTESESEPLDCIEFRKIEGTPLEDSFYYFHYEGKPLTTLTLIEDVL